LLGVVAAAAAARNKQDFPGLAYFASAKNKQKFRRLNPIGSSTAECIRTSQILATVARADRTTTTTWYLAIFDSTEWERGRKEWYPLTL
jgi:hypothetical protein